MLDRVRAEPNRLLISRHRRGAGACARRVGAPGDRLEVITALAGRTEQPGPLAGKVRIGGFGGVDGLAAYLTEAAIDLLIDATHPFADGIARHARSAGCWSAPRLVLERPPWRRHPLDRWIEVEDFAGVAAAVARVGRRCFLTVGAGGFRRLQGLSDVQNLPSA